MHNMKRRKVVPWARARLSFFIGKLAGQPAWESGGRQISCWLRSLSSSCFNSARALGKQPGWEMWNPRSDLAVTTGISPGRCKWRCTDPPAWCREARGHGGVNTWGEPVSPGVIYLAFQGVTRKKWTLLGKQSLCCDSLMSGVARNSEADAIKVFFFPPFSIVRSGDNSWSMANVCFHLCHPLMALALSSSDSSCSGRKLGQSPVLWSTASSLVIPAKLPGTQKPVCYSMWNSRAEI